MGDPRGVELILLECGTDFGNVDISFGGDNFTLTVSEKGGGPLAAAACGTYQSRCSQFVRAR